MSKSTTRKVLPVAVPVALALVCSVPAAAQAAPTAERAASSQSSFSFSPLPNKRFGFSVPTKKGESQSAAIDRAIRTYGSGPLRLFYPNMPAKWSRINRMSHGLPLVVSFKALPSAILSGKYDARLKSWFKEAPESRTTWWSYEPEPENDIQRGRYTAAQFRRAYGHIAALARKAKNDRLKSTLILMAWTPNKGSKRDYRDYWPGSKNVDVIAFDFYNNYGLRTGKYVKPSRNLDVCMNLAKSLNKDWGLGEFGSKKLRGDKSGAGRAKWLRDMSDYLDSHRAQFGIYWDQVGKVDYRLTDTASRNAWKAVVSNQ